MKTGVQLISEERNRQMAEEGWTPDHDSGHHKSELALAAVCYAIPAWRRKKISKNGRPKLWPWSAKWWKPARHLDGRGYYDDADERIKELIKAGALIAAEIDRIHDEFKKPGLEK